MATRPLAFGLRFRHRGRSLEVREDTRAPGRYVVERSGRRATPERREHASLGEALSDFARTWRGRLH
jgi:hypothetical protein